MSQTNWRVLGACANLTEDDPALLESFYADTTAGRAPAKEVCAGCPVRLQCLTSALERGETWGVWGGCDEIDLRRTLRIDSSGSPKPRLRFPRCPACEARAENLFVRGHCGIGGAGSEQSVECQACGFGWRDAGSSEAVVEYWDTRGPEAPVVPIRRARVRVPRGRIPSGRPSRRSQPVAAPVRAGSQDRDVVGLAASAAPDAL